MQKFIQIKILFLSSKVFQSFRLFPQTDNYRSRPNKLQCKKLQTRKKIYFSVHFQNPILQQSNIRILPNSQINSLRKIKIKNIIPMIILLVISTLIAISYTAFTDIYYPVISQTQFTATNGPNIKSFETQSTLPTLFPPSLTRSLSIPSFLQLQPPKPFSSFIQLQSPASLIASPQKMTYPQINFDFPSNQFVRPEPDLNTFHPKPNLMSPASTLNFSSNTFSGFSDSYKSQMAYLIASIKNLNTTQGKYITDRLTINLISVDNTLRLINMDPSRQQELKPLLKFQVNQFLSDIDMAKDHISKRQNSVVIGDDNIAIGKGVTIQGDGNVAIGGSNLIVGNNNALIGNQSIISGDNNGMIGNNGMTVGKNNEVIANNSFVFTSNDVVNTDNSLVVGNYSIDLKKLNGQGSYLQRN